MKKSVTMMWAILLAILLTCCSAPMSQHPVRRVVSDRVFDKSKPGVVQEKAVGEIMVEIGRVVYEKDLGFQTNNSVPPYSFHGINYPEIPKGTLFKCNYATDEGDYICSNNEQEIAKTTFGGNIQYTRRLIISPEGHLKGIVRGRGGYASYFDSAKMNVFSKKEYEIPKEGTFKQELIYQGKTKDSIKISYREYRDDLARPAFFQDLTYDISESKEIAFRDMRIDVISANNVSIRFVVK